MMGTWPWVLIRNDCKTSPSIGKLTDLERDYNSITMKCLEEWLLDWLILGNIQLHTQKNQQNTFEDFFLDISASITGSFWNLTI